MPSRNLRVLGLSLGGAILLAIPFAIVACTNPNQEDTTADIVHICSSCHGIEGRSVSSNFPRLAGQQKPYIIAQLKAFKDHARADWRAHTYMWGMAGRLEDATREEVAAYFSSQTPVAGSPGDPADIAAGKKIYREGIADRGVSACFGCHGDHAQGFDSSPRLAGQHRDYTERRLEAFASNAYVNESIHKNSKTITDVQARQLATYLASE